ncbi:fumarate and nitrate reduction regulatory protein, partial [Vibrio parahaemolyticus VP2007-007]
HASNE